MDRAAPFESVLGVFAYYGFRKASMDELARAANVSRQTLYNRFETKEAVLDWAVAGFIQAVLERAVSELGKRKASAAKCLLEAFSRWTGDHVAIFHDAPHGAEIIDVGTDSLKRSKIDPHAEFEDAVAQFLKDRGVCRTRKAAADKAYLLHMSSKGLLLKSRTREEFQVGMARIIKAAM